MLHLHRLDQHEHGARLDLLAHLDRHADDDPGQCAREAAARRAGTKLALPRIFEHEFLVRILEPQVHARAAAQGARREASRADAHRHGRSADTGFRERHGGRPIDAGAHGARALELKLHRVAFPVAVEAQLHERRQIGCEAIRDFPGMCGARAGAGGRVRDQGGQDQRLGARVRAEDRRGAASSRNAMLWRT